MKKLGFGLMRMPLLDKTNAADVDIEQVKKMVDVFSEKGFTYFDTAWMYNGFASEGVAKAALVDRYPRDSFTLATKLHAGFVNTLEDRTHQPEEEDQYRQDQENDKDTCDGNNTHGSPIIGILKLIFSSSQSLDPVDHVSALREQTKRSVHVTTPFL